MQAGADSQNRVAAWLVRFDALSGTELLTQRHRKRLMLVSVILMELPALVSSLWALLVAATTARSVRVNGTTVFVRKFATKNNRGGNGK
jgi:hypothetical protein